MRITVTIDDALVTKAIQLTGAKTKREAVEMGLKMHVRIKIQEKIRAYKGKLKWDADHHP